jgi:hypothetical protein
MKDLLIRFLKDESAATAIEYGLIAAGDFAGDHCRRVEPRHKAQVVFQLDLDPAQITRPVCISAALAEPAGRGPVDLHLLQRMPIFCP